MWTIQSFIFLYKKDQPTQQPLNYIYVESIEQYSKKITDLGGKILVSKTEVPSMGWFAVAQDPEGNTFDIFETIPM